MAEDRVYRKFVSGPVPGIKFKGYKAGPKPIKYKASVTSPIRQGESGVISVFFQGDKKKEYTPIIRVLRITRKGGESFGPLDSTPTRVFIGAPRRASHPIMNRINHRFVVQFYIAIITTLETIPGEYTVDIGYDSEENLGEIPEGQTWEEKSFNPTSIPMGYGFSLKFKVEPGDQFNPRVVLAFAKEGSGLFTYLGPFYPSSLIVETKAKAFPTMPSYLEETETWTNYRIPGANAMIEAHPWSLRVRSEPPVPGFPGGRPFTKQVGEFKLKAVAGHSEGDSRYYMISGNMMSRFPDGDYMVISIYGVVEAKYSKELEKVILSFGNPGDQEPGVIEYTWNIKSGVGETWTVKLDDMFGE
ncbi:MAG: hypothetical protein ACTSPE_12145 [Candidatus Thorarchaeota archaeon]